MFFMLLVSSLADKEWDPKECPMKEEPIFAPTTTQEKW